MGQHHHRSYLDTLGRPGTQHSAQAYWLGPAGPHTCSTKDTGMLATPYLKPSSANRASSVGITNSSGSSCFLTSCRLQGDL